MPSCSQMRLQLLHFHAVLKTWPTFQELSKRPSFRSEGDAGVNWISAKIETYRVTKIEIYLVKYEHYDEIFFLDSRRLRCRPRLLEVPIESFNTYYAENMKFGQSSYQNQKYPFWWLSINSFCEVTGSPTDVSPVDVVLSATCKRSAVQCSAVQRGVVQSSAV